MLFAQQNTVKTANRNSIINFYFVTAFYLIDDICIADGMPSELGILNFEFLLRQAAKPSDELFSASPAILNYSILKWKISFY